MSLAESPPQGDFRCLCCFVDSCETEFGNVSESIFLFQTELLALAAVPLYHLFNSSGIEIEDVSQRHCTSRAETRSRGFWPFRLLLKDCGIYVADMREWHCASQVESPPPCIQPSPPLLRTLWHQYQRRAGVAKVGVE